MKNYDGAITCLTKDIQDQPGNVSMRLFKKFIQKFESTNSAAERTEYGCFGKVFVSGYIPFFTPQRLPRELVSGFLGMYPSHTIKNGSVIIYPIHDPTPPATAFDRLCHLLCRYVPGSHNTFAVHRDRL